MSEHVPPPLLLNLWIANQLVGTLLEQAFDGAGVPARDWALHSAIAVLGPLSPTELATCTRMPLSTVVFRTRSLTARGHVERRPNPRDGRSYLLAVTDEGRAAFERARPAFVAAKQAIERRLSRPAEEVDDMLRELADAIAREVTSRTSAGSS